MGPKKSKAVKKEDGRWENPIYQPKKKRIIKKVDPGRCQVLHHHHHNFPWNSNQTLTPA